MAEDDKEVNIAIVALIVSLIALVVTLSQLLAQLFSSADGYRRCAESVIDVWSSRRHRVWKWSEFRFETQYVTPQIVLASPHEILDYEDEFGEIYLINSPDLNNENCKEIEKTVHEAYIGFGRRRKERAALKEKTQGKKSLNGATMRRCGNIGIEDAEKAVVIPNQSGPGKFTTARRTRVKHESDPLVSWLRLLRELHQVAYSYWPQDCPTCTFPKWDKTETGIVQSDHDSLRKLEHDEQSNYERTDIAVIYRQWTWDFMPPDMVRPLAQVSFGDIILLALRMGMQWRALDLESGRMQADGNGFNLTATDVKGMGVVLRFTAAGYHDRYPRLIPSRAVDKLLLGIVPGDSQLVKKDFPLIGDGGDILNIAAHTSVLHRFGMGPPRRKRLEEHSNVEVSNDVFTLLMPFLPLEGSTMASYCFPGWHSEPGIRSVFCFWEGRLGLHRKLKSRLEDQSLDSMLKETLEQVLSHVDHLSQTWHDDWYSLSGRASAIRNENGWEAKLACLNDTRRVHDWTTSYFVSRQFAAMEGGFGRNTKYCHLVAAHALMADHAIQACAAFLATYPAPARAQPALRDMYQVTGTQYSGYFVQDLYEIAAHYVAHIGHARHGIGAYMRDKGVEMTDSEAEATWWVLMLRGIAWNLGTWHPDGIVKKVLGEKLVPSSFYGSQRPIWIT